MRCMVGNVSIWAVEPVANPSLREGKRRRVIRTTKEYMTKQQTGQGAPMRQVLHRDHVVAPLALEASCRGLLRRVQCALGIIIAAKAYAGDLSSIIPESALRRQEWEIALALREMTELKMEVALTARSAGPMTATVLSSQKRAITIAENATTVRVVAFERLADQVAAVEAAWRDWETAQQVAARNDKYLGLIARTAADEHATLEITGLAEQATEAAHVLRETLAQAALAAEALALPERR